MRVENDDLWNKIKDGDYLGFSLKVMFTEKEQFSKIEIDVMEEIEELLNLYNNES